MSAHPFDYLDLANGARFVFTPCPGTKNTSIKEALETLARAGAKHVITLLSADEMQSLSVASLGEDAKEMGLSWFQLPVQDDCEPAEEFDRAWVEVKGELLSLLKKKETIAIHCRGGSGRTGLMAAILLLEAGASWLDVKQKIQSVRPKALTLPVHIHYLRKHYSI